jgi:phosphoglycolate phosphatase-like HAD superfamily hydrolase
VEDTVYVGDMVLDVESAARAGIPVLLVPGGSSSAAELRATGQRVLERLTDLPGLLSCWRVR